MITASALVTVAILPFRSPGPGGAPVTLGVFLYEVHRRGEVGEHSDAVVEKA